MASSLLKKLVETFNKKTDSAIKFITDKSDIKNKKYYFKHVKGAEFYWQLGKFYNSGDKKNKYIERLNSDQELISICREMDKIVDEQSTRPFLGKYFNY